MKKLLTLTTVGAMLATPASAVQKCVALGANADMGTLVSTNYPRQTSDWNVVYSNITIAGIAICSNHPGDQFDTASSLSHNQSEDTKYCWGRILSPIVSDWYLSATFDNGGHCAEDCAFNVQADITNDEGIGRMDFLYENPAY